MRQPIKKLEVIIEKVIRETDDTTTLYLFSGNDKLEYEAGHFLTIDPHQFRRLDRWIRFLEDSKGKKEPPRAYSMSSSPDEKQLSITIKEERYISGVTRYPPLLSPGLVRSTYPGRKLIITGFTGPYTLKDSLRKQYNHFLHIIAGSGIVPSFSLIKHDLRNYQNTKHTLLYSNKTIHETIFYRQLNKLAEEFPDRFEIVYALTREPQAAKLCQNSRQGRINLDLLKEFIPDPENIAIFTCGPDHNSWKKKEAKEKGISLAPSFIEKVLEDLTTIGISSQQIIKESYG